MAKLKLILDSSFLSKKSEDYYKKAQHVNHNIQKRHSKPRGEDYDSVTLTFGEVYNAIKSFDPATIKFNERDEFEITRGYYFSEKYPASTVTLDDFRNFLSKKNISKERQDFIFYIMLQSQVGWTFAVGHAVGAILSSLSNLSLATQYSRVYLKLNKDIVTFNFYMPVKCYIKGEEKWIGHVESVFALYPNNEFSMKPIVIELNEEAGFSLNRIKKDLKNYVKPGLQFKTNQFLKTLKISSRAQSFSEIINNFYNFIKKHRMISAFVFCGLLGLIGVALSLTGIFSPLGMLLTGLSIQFSLAGITAIDVGIYLGLTALFGGLMSKITNAMNFELVNIFHVKPSNPASIVLTTESDSTILPPVFAPTLTPVLSKEVIEKVEPTNSEQSVDELIQQVIQVAQQLANVPTLSDPTVRTTQVTEEEEITYQSFMDLFATPKNNRSLSREGSYFSSNDEDNFPQYQSNLVI